jgi:hypothetical protein
MKVGFEKKVKEVKKLQEGEGGGGRSWKWPVRQLRIPVRILFLRGWSIVNFP